MATTQSKLDILIDAKNNASATLRQVAGDAQGASNSFLDLGDAMGFAFSAAGVYKVAEAGYELARTGAEASRLERSFATLAGQAGQSGNQMLEAMRDAAQGAISDTNLMLGANRAMLLEVADTGQEMAGLLEVAAARGKAMGMSTSEAFSDIVTGIGRLSPMILDNLGIVVNTDSAYSAYAQSIGKVVSALTEQEKKQALVNEILRNSAELVAANEGRDAAGDFEALSASFDNLKTSAGKLIEAPVAMWARGAAIELDRQRAILVAMRDGFEWVYIGAKNFATGGHEVTTATLEMAQAEGKADAITHNLTFALNTAGDAAANAGPKLRAMGIDALAAMDAFNQAMSLSQGIARSIDSAAAGAGAFFAGKQGGDAGLSRQRAVTEQLKAQVDAWKEQGYTEREISEVLLPGMVSQINEADRALFNTSVSTKALSDEAREAERAFNDLKGKVEGVLSSALDTGTGVDPDKVLEALGLPRPDAINENARRLADIAANGLKGQDWLGAFQSEVPDIWQMLRLASNPQEEAAHLLRDFQDGLLTSAIDKDKAKEIVKRQILGDQNMAALAQEIASELAAEMGVPLQQALGAAQGALGVSGTSGLAGESAATSFSDGANQTIEGSDAGGSFVDKFIAQTQARYANIKTAGGEAGRQWGQGFLAVVGDNVPPGLISLLTDLVTPGVMAKFAQQGTLTNAAP